eukprot:1324287-Amphidinium_carterae.1
MIRQRFQFGKWQEMRGQGRFDFSGRTLEQTMDGEVIIHMERYVHKTLKPIPVTKEQNKQKQDNASPIEVSQYRALIGGLLWVARCCAPQCMGDVSLMAARVSTLKVSDLGELNQILQRAQNNIRPLRIKSITPANTRWAIWTDASLANLDEGRTQLAWLLAQSTPSLTKEPTSLVNIIGWSSHKMHRVASSTLMTEMVSLCEALGEA